MKYFSPVLLALFACFIIGNSAFAQAIATPKIALIDTAAFYDEKTGITKLVNANKQLDREFAPRIKELQDGGARLQAIAKDLENMQRLPPAQVDRAAYSAKQEEGARLDRELGFKKTDLEAAINKRRVAVIGPISQDIGRAFGEYAKKNGFGLVLDVGKLADVNAVLYFAETAESTKDFILFYNTRPAAPAAPAARAAAPK